VFLRGLLMGAADIVPGVSGGTVAFITGIYDTLIDSIRAVDATFVRRLLQLDIGGAWEHVNGGFLLALLLGIATSIFSLARAISWVLEHYPVPLWAFFFGLILASALVLLRQVGGWNAARVVSLLVGAAVALAIALSPVVSLDGGLPGVFLAGFLAICAMILPGISGSFILVLLGMYGTVLAAVKSLDLFFLVVFAAGAGSGLLCFSRLLYWLLHHYHQGTMALLTGFLFGSLAVVWPWKRVLGWVEGSHGQLKPAQQVPVSPVEFTVATGQEAWVGLCLALMVVGFVAVWLIDARWGRR
jgi:putative membrane protein